MGFWVRRSFCVPLIVVTLAAFGFALVLGRSRAELFELRKRDAALVGTLRALSGERELLREERRRLLSEPAAVERVARDQYGFAAPGELSVPFEAEQGPRTRPVAMTNAESAWDRLLGRGAYPWLMTAGVFVVSAIVLAALELAPSRQRRQGPSR